SGPTTPLSRRDPIRFASHPATNASASNAAVVRATLLIHTSRAPARSMKHQAERGVEGGPGASAEDVVARRDHHDDLARVQDRRAGADVDEGDEHLRRRPAR